MINDKDVTSKLGHPVEFSFGFHSGSLQLYEDQIMVETFGSIGNIDCIHRLELQVDANTLAAGATKADVSALLGPPQGAGHHTDYYRVQGHVRLAIWYEQTESVRYFALYSGVGAKQQYGWERRIFPHKDTTFPFPFALEPTHSSP